MFKKYERLLNPVVNIHYSGGGGGGGFAVTYFGLQTDRAVRKDLQMGS